MSSSPAPSRRQLTKAQRYAEQCKPLPAMAGETLEQRVDRLDRSLDYLTQCFQDEFEVRDEGTLLVDVIVQVLLPFAALSTAASLLYVRLVEWSSARHPDFERFAAYTYFGLLVLGLLVAVFAHKRGRLKWVNRTIDWIADYTHSTVPIRKETLTRNTLVNRWIYFWMVGALTVFIPLTFIVLRSGIGDDLGIRVVIDTANICDGPGRVHLFTGSQTCVEIQEENQGTPDDTGLQNATGDGAAPVLGTVELADTALEAHVAEIRLDATTTLAITVLLLVVGIVVSMALWWWRNREVREIEVL